MDSLVKFTKQYKASLIIAIAIIMFILFGFCSAVDVAGKAKVCGLKILFEGDGLGFSRFLSALILLAPAWASWLYMLAGVIGIAVCNIEKLTNN